MVYQEYLSRQLIQTTMTNKLLMRNTMLSQVLTVFVLVLTLAPNQALTEQKDQNVSTKPVKDDELKPQIGRMGEARGVDPEVFEFSSAERKIWLDAHLDNINSPARLYYEFVKTGSYEDGFTDSVYLDVIEINEDGSKNTTLEFFTQDRKQKAGAENLNFIKGNPVIGVYMQGDVMDMNRLTEGSWRYFQKQIKFAISDDAKIETVSFSFNGKSIEGEKVTITPYVNDPRRRQFQNFANKRYEFIFSKHIPGSLYQIKTITPGSSGSDKEPLLKETLTLQNVEIRS
jgi:hypothetical protein